MDAKELQNRLIATRNKEICYDFAVACAEKAAEINGSPLFSEIAGLMRNNRWEYNRVGKYFHGLAAARVNEKQIDKKESIHTMIHAIEISSVHSIQSIAAHAARCGNALSRINESLAEEICSRILSPIENE